MISPVELRKITDAGRSISTELGVALEEWADGEMGLILSKWAARIPTPRPAEVKLRARGQTSRKLGTDELNNPLGITVNTGLRKGRPGMVWVPSEGKGKGKKRFRPLGVIEDDSRFEPLPIHWKASAWARLSGAAEKYAGTVSEAVIAGLRAVGLARQSVVQMADALGIKIESVAGGPFTGAGVAQARAARASNGRSYVNGTGERIKTPDSFSLNGVNTYPTSTPQMSLELQAVVMERVAAAEALLSSRVRRSLATVSRTHPYITTT